MTFGMLGCSETLSSPGNGEIVSPLRLNEWQALHGRDAGISELRFRDPSAAEGVLGDDTDADVTTFDLKRDVTMAYNFFQGLDPTHYFSKAEFSCSRGVGCTNVITFIFKDDPEFLFRPITANDPTPVISVGLRKGTAFRLFVRRPNGVTETHPLAKDYSVSFTLKREDNDPPFVEAYTLLHPDVPGFPGMSHLRKGLCLEEDPTGALSACASQPGLYLAGHGEIGATFSEPMRYMSFFSDPPDPHNYGAWIQLRTDLGGNLSGVANQQPLPLGMQFHTFDLLSRDTFGQHLDEDTRFFFGVATQDMSGMELVNHVGTNGLQPTSFIQRFSVSRFRFNPPPSINAQTDVSQPIDLFTNYRTGTGSQRRGAVERVRLLPPHGNGSSTIALIYTGTNSTSLSGKIPMDFSTMSDGPPPEYTQKLVFEALNSQGEVVGWDFGSAVIKRTPPPIPQFASLGGRPVPADKRVCSNQVPTTYVISNAEPGEVFDVLAYRTGQTDPSRGDSTASGTIPGLSDGTYNITALGRDVAGNESGLATGYVLQLDRQPPLLAVAPIPTPTDATLLQVSGTTDALTAVTVFSDMTETVISDASGAFSASIRIGPGPNEIVVKASDCAGNETTVKAMVTNSLTPPVLTVSPSFAATTLGATVNISWAVATPSPASTVLIGPEDLGIARSQLSGSVGVVARGRRFYTFSAYRTDGNGAIVPETLVFKSVEVDPGQTIETNYREPKGGRFVTPPLVAQSKTQRTQPVGTVHVDWGPFISNAFPVELCFCKASGDECVTDSARALAWVQRLAVAETADVRVGVSADSRFVAVIQRVPKAGLADFKVSLVNLESGQEVFSSAKSNVQVTGTRRRDMDARFSPDGQFFMFVDRDDGATGSSTIMNSPSGTASSAQAPFRIGNAFVQQVGCANGLSVTTSCEPDAAVDISAVSPLGLAITLVGNDAAPTNIGKIDASHPLALSSGKMVPVKDCVLEMSGVDVGGAPVSEGKVLSPAASVAVVASQTATLDALLWPDVTVCVEGPSYTQQTPGGVDVTTSVPVEAIDFVVDANGASGGPKVTLSALPFSAGGVGRSAVFTAVAPSDTVDDVRFSVRIRARTSTGETVTRSCPEMRMTVRKLTRFDLDPTRPTEPPTGPQYWHTAIPPVRCAFTDADFLATAGILRKFHFTLVDHLGMAVPRTVEADEFVIAKEPIQQGGNTAPNGKFFDCVARASGLIGSGKNGMEVIKVALGSTGGILKRPQQFYARPQGVPRPVGGRGCGMGNRCQLLTASSVEHLPGSCPP